MKVSRAITLLLEEDQDSEVMIQWFTKEHVESNLTRKLPLPTGRWQLMYLITARYQWIPLRYTTV
jgi:hypothetical protein